MHHSLGAVSLWPGKGPAHGVMTFSLKPVSASDAATLNLRGCLLRLAFLQLDHLDMHVYKGFVHDPTAHLYPT